MPQFLVYLGFFFLFFAVVEGLHRAFDRHGVDKEDLVDLPEQSTDQALPAKRQGYQSVWCVMNASEQAFFFELRKQLPSRFYVFPKMRIADMIRPVHDSRYNFHIKKILPKHIDFLICDEKMKPCVAIEVNGSSHRIPDRISRDKLVKEIFDDAKLPLEFVNVGTDFTEQVQRIVATLIQGDNTKNARMSLPKIQIRMSKN